MPKPLNQKRAASQQTQSPRVALDEGIIHASPPRKRQKINRARGLTGTTAPTQGDPSVRPPVNVPGFRIRPLGNADECRDRRWAWCLDFRHRHVRFCKVIGHSDMMDEAAARQIAARLISEVKRGAVHRPVTEQECRFDGFADTFFRRYAHNWKPVTAAGSRRASSAYLLPFFAAMDVRDITPDHVRRWFEGLASHLCPLFAGYGIPGGTLGKDAFRRT